MSGVEWTQEDEQYVINNYLSQTPQQIAKHLNRSLSSVYGMAHKQGLKKFTYYSNEDDDFIRQNYKTMSFPEMGEHLNRSSDSVKNHMADVLKLKRTPAESKAIMNRRSLNTQFKKGNLPHNTRSDGEIGIRDGYQYIRISIRKWVLLHRYNYEQAFGEIPKDHNVVFKDNNRMNCDPSNLELVSNAELMHRNSIMRYPENIRKGIRLIGKLNSKIRDHEK